jgi:CO dehydrogenase/acetyl-CoA synthase beta subunit
MLHPRPVVEGAHKEEERMEEEEEKEEERKVEEEKEEERKEGLGVGEHLQQMLTYADVC